MPRWILVWVLLLLAGCSKRATYIQVRDPGLVSVSAGTPAGWAPALPPDRRDAVARVSPEANVVRSGGTLSVHWPESDRKRALIDERGQLARAKSRAGIRAQGGLLFVPYAVSERGVYAYDELARRPEAEAVLLATPTYNVDHARYEEGLHKWPGYVLIPVGGLLTLTGVAVMANADGEWEGLERLAGGFLLVAGAPALGIGIYFAASGVEVTPLAPGVSTGVE